ncbi:serine hydrolase domain-containing protein [Mucilaginibacter lappiensis]|uniref:CubicO group peptidase (Beta-lactamase class C family) n=1 Tax=Mucilaginibacter lappiensis TaxID=354630 RepID=A0A841JR09_9SPHI|nr:serine hydrolase domain-containing protein [Mucilaginibacter lappiensis]MBB6130291.1 CubicO group peptidase (beta-lactamase class C family) [Mucilaginibacter lappiensis]
MKTSRYIFIIPLLLIRLVAVAQSLKPTDEVRDKIQQVEKNLVGRVQIEGEGPWTIQERMALYKVPGLSIAVIHNYKIEWTKSYGWADVDQKIPVTDNTLFQAASLSKSLNAVGVLKLAQEHRLDLDKDINDYLVSWKFPYDSVSKGKKITAKNLLSHTAGLNVHGFKGYTNGTAIPTVVQVLNGSKPANSEAIHSMTEPGLRSEYSGGGTTISQLVVVDITHEPYDQFMKREVLKPLGMIASTFSQPPAEIKPTLLATGYRVDGKEVPGKYNVYPEEAAAGLWTNPTDLSKYIIETQLAYEGRSSKVLDQATTQLRLTPYLNKVAALGVFINDFNGLKYFGHSGSNEGFVCQYNGSLEGGNGLVIMVNSDNGAIIAEISNSIAKVYQLKGLYRSKVFKPIAVDAAVLQSYIGKYELKQDLMMTIVLEGNQLYSLVNDEHKRAITPETQSKFFFKEDGSEIEFIKNDKMEVEKIAFFQGSILEAKKIK